MVRLEFTITAAELQESLASIQRGGKPIRWVLSTVIWAFNLCQILFYIYLIADRRHSDFSQNFWLVLIPPFASMLAVTISRIVAHVSTMRNRKPTVLAGTAYGRVATIILALSFLLPYAFLVVPIVPELAVYWHPSPALELIVGMLPWVCYFMGNLIVATIRSRSRGRAALAIFPLLRLPNIVDISDEGIHHADGVVDAHYRWPFFLRFRETSNMIILTTVQNTQMFLPKRAAQSQADLHQLLALMQTHIGYGKFQPRESRFPVLMDHPAPTASLEKIS